MKRVLMVLALCAPLSAFAEGAAKDPLTGGSAEAGAGKAAVCTACHGPGGNSANPEWPKLAGQSSRYISEQLHRFKSGKRVNPLMSAQAAGLSDDDIKDLAAYFAAQKTAPGVASEAAVPVAQKIFRAGDASRGLPACGSCHGPTGAGAAPAAYPRIGGQQGTYVANRLKAYREAAKGELEDGNFKIMSQVAAKLSDAEIEALSSYVGGLQ
ncbi:Cytochrome c553 [Solimonas aquatica]|uniref:Cytochrome c553 n=1 Tax=Solimonas aquatica TaxID=489703 RepID=A0A1H9EKE5_9GAMM|nr:c-type cytochrome [Solimonas aquatica]SEQ26151.1 Cytochrome c553 [Solimonas aquatica]